MKRLSLILALMLLASCSGMRAGSNSSGTGASGASGTSGTSGSSGSAYPGTIQDDLYRPGG